MSDEPSWQLIDAYLAGTATAEQREVVHRWLTAQPERRIVLDALRAGSQPDAVAWDVDAAWARVAADIGRHTVAPVIPFHQRARRYDRVWRIAAAMLVALGLGALWRGSVQWRAPSHEAPMAMREVASGPGQRIVIDLRDGSHVTLNAGSRLRYDASSSGPREVTLDGEAYFEVRHDPNRPFRVHAHGGIAEDVGTRFVVRAYAEQDRVEVAVAEGAVRVLRTAHSSDAALVSAGMLGIIPESGQLRVSTLGTREGYFAWTRGVLALDGQPLRDAIPALERWYGVTIQIADTTLASTRVFGTFEHETRQQAMAAIALALDATYRETGRSVTLTPRER